MFVSTKKRAAAGTVVSIEPPAPIDAHRLPATLQNDGGYERIGARLRDSGGGWAAQAAANVAI